VPRVFIIAHDHNPGLFYQPDAAHRWVGEETEARRFDCEDLALEAIIRDLDGKGRALELRLPMIAGA